MKKTLSVLLTLALLLSGVLSVAAAPAADAPLMDGATLVTFGDSITALSTWPRSVAKATNMHLINAGIGGNTSDQGLARFDRDVIARDPDFVIMSFATNDFYIEDGKTAARVSIAKYKENLHYFIDRIEAIGATPILLTAPFLREGALGDGSRFSEGSDNLALDKYITAMREVASEAGAHLIDIHAVCDSGYNPSTFLISDGIHLAAQGNQVYTDTITAYLKDHFRQDASAPRVTTNDPPALQSGAWTKSLISFDAADWLVLFPGTLYATENADGTLSFANTTGGWPELHYSPGFSQMFYAPVANSVLTLDMELTAGANISLYFDGPTPTHEYTNTSIPLAPILEANCPSVAVNGHDISGGQDIRVSVPLSAVVPSQYIRTDGTVLLSGVKMLVVGAADTPVTFNEFSVTCGTPDAPLYQTADSLLPTATSAIAQAEGVADFTLNKTLTLARSAQSDIAWPSVKVTCGKTIDLHKTPYLHLRMTANGGSGNGFINYTDAWGNQGSVRLSELVYGTADDFASDMDVYVDLASAIQTGGTITVTDYTLSVYGVVGDSVTWHTLGTANAFTGLIGDANEDGRVDTADASAIFRHVTAAVTLSDSALAAADYDGDGRVSSSDVRLILDYIVHH